MISIIDSCKKENFSSQTKIEQGRVAKNVSIADLQKAISSNASLDLNKITAQSTGSQSIEDFFIDTTQILETKNNSNSYFYSMQLLSKKQNTRKYFYNYFIIKDSLGRVKKYIIKFTPTAETIKNKYKNFKGTYEVIPEITTSTGKIKSNSTGIVSNSVGCVEVAYDIPCEYGYIHPEGNGPGLWCDGTGSHTEKIQVGDCGSSGGSSGQSGGNSSNGNNVVVPPTFYANNIVQCEDAVVDNFIYNVYTIYQNFAFTHTNEFNQLVGGLCGNFSEEKKAYIIIYLETKLNENYCTADDFEHDEDENNISDQNDPVELMPASITLHTGKVISITFGVTADGEGAQKTVSKRLITALTQALELASVYVEINSINVFATTNGTHTSPKSNHYKGLALDISKINGIPIILLGLDEKVIRLQGAFEAVPNRRENFGPVLKLKLGLPWAIGGHQDHIHFSINGQ